MMGVFVIAPLPPLVEDIGCSKAPSADFNIDTNAARPERVGWHTRFCLRRHGSRPTAYARWQPPRDSSTRRMLPTLRDVGAA
jgi:hypothetical protein